MQHLNTNGRDVSLFDEGLRPFISLFLAAATQYFHPQLRKSSQLHGRRPAPRLDSQNHNLRAKKLRVRAAGLVCPRRFHVGMWLKLALQLFLVTTHSSCLFFFFFCCFFVLEVEKADGAHFRAPAFKLGSDDGCVVCMQNEPSILHQNYSVRRTTKTFNWSVL